MLSDEEMHERMAGGWRMGRPFTECGNGSTLQATEQVRAWLPAICSKYGIRTLNDAGAGDLAWIKLIQWRRPLEYRPFDLIPRLPDVQKADITTEMLPPADAVLCRMVLNHLDAPRVGMALELFRRSAAYLIATQYDGDNLPARSSQFHRLDLRSWLGNPLEATDDALDNCCRLAIWKL